MTRLSNFFRLEHPLMAVVLAGLSGMATEALAAGYSVQQVNLPGEASRMSNNGSITGSYETKCTVINGKEHYTYCFYAPYFYSRGKLSKIATPTDAQYFSSAINDSLELAGGAPVPGWLYSAGTFTSMTGTTGGGPNSINNFGIAAGSSPNASYVYRATRYTNGVGNEVTFNDPFLSSSTTPSWATDINDAGMVAGYYQSGPSNYQGFVVDAAGNVTYVPMLAGETMCRPVRISQVNPMTGQVFVVGSCNQRDFIFELLTGSLTELANLPGGYSLAVKSVNSSGIAVGNTSLPGGVPTAVVWPAGATAPIDLNAMLAFAPSGTPIMRTTDINEAGEILIAYYSRNYNLNTVLLQPVP